MKRMTMVVLILLLTLGTAPALAGENSLLVATSDQGATVYTKTSGGQKAGILYNGFQCSLSLEEENGLYDAWLTSYFTGYVNQDKAMANLPDGSWSMKREERAALPCGAWLAEICQPDAPFYGRPGEKKRLGTHAVGTRVIVWGEFGKDYYVSMSGGMSGWPTQSYFMSAGSLRKVRDLPALGDAAQATQAIAQGTVHTGGRKIRTAPTATRICSEDWGRMYGDGAKVEILTYLGDWAQLTNGTFLETRFLAPEGDHSPSNLAAVKTDGVLNRLNVRSESDVESRSVAKLCSGVRVEVISQTEEWANIFLTGPAGGEIITGSVKKEFLAFGADTDQVEDGRVSARMDGETLTLIGVRDGFDIQENDWGDCFLALTEGGELKWVKNTGGVLEPLTTFGLFAKTTDSVRLREAPSTESKVLRTLNRGAKVEVLLRGEGWTLVRRDTQTGYVMSRYLRFP